MPLESCMWATPSISAEAQPLGLEDQLWVIWSMNPRTVCVNGYLQGSQTDAVIWTIGTINGCVYTASRGWVSSWPSHHWSGPSHRCMILSWRVPGTVVCPGQCHKGVWGQQCEPCGYDAEEVEHMPCFQLLSAWDSLSCQKYTHFSYWKSSSQAFGSSGPISQIYTGIFLLAMGTLGSVGLVGGDILESNSQSLCSRVGFLQSLVSHCNNKHSTKAWTEAALWSCYLWSRCSLGSE